MSGNRRRAGRAALLIAAVAAGAGLAVRPAPAEIGIGVAESGGLTVAPEGPVVLECWQNGVRVVNRAGLPGPGTGTGGDRVVFGRGGQGSAVLVGFPEALCLITEQ